MKKLILSIVCLLMVRLSFSQIQYPKKQVQEGDTVVVITPKQLAVVNGIIQQRNGCLEEIECLNNVVASQDSLISVYSAQISHFEDLNTLNGKSIDGLTKSLEMAEKTRRRDCWIVGGISLGVGILVGLLIGK